MKIGCLGFGQVGSTFAVTLAAHGAEVCCFDPRLGERESTHPGITFASLDAALAGAELVISMVPTDVAQGLARQAAAHLGTGQIYVDLNSTAPAVKREIARIVMQRDAIFVEGAVLGLVAATGSHTRILLGGPHAAATADVLNAHGLNCEAYREAIGAASSFKMLRSIFSKGLEALLIETLLAADRAGIRDDIWAELCGTIDSQPFDRLARSWITSHAVACQRRRDEMVQVIEVVAALGLTPTMCSATRDVLERSTRAALHEAFAAPPDDISDVIGWLDRNAG